MPSLTVIAMLGQSYKQAVYRSKNPREWLDNHLQKIISLEQVDDYLEVLTCMEDLFTYKGKGRDGSCSPKELSEWLGVEFIEGDSIVSIMTKYIELIKLEKGQKEVEKS